jgi:hypothetical protein
MELNEICRISDKSLHKDPIVEGYLVHYIYSRYADLFSTLDVIFQHYIIIEKSDMLHGSTTEHLFFQFKANFDKYNDYKFMCEIDDTQEKKKNINSDFKLFF